MKCFTSYAKFHPDTTLGHRIVVTQMYTTFNEDEINALDEHLRDTIGSGVMTDFCPNPTRCHECNRILSCDHFSDNVVGCDEFERSEDERLNRQTGSD